MRKIFRIHLGHRIINNRTDEESRLNDVNVAPLDQLEEGAKEDPTSRTGTTNAEVVLVDAELGRVVVDVLDGLREVSCTGGCLVAFFPEVD